MAISLYDLTIPSYLQILAATNGILDKGSSFANESGTSLDEIVNTRLRDDMNPLRFQVVSVWHHSLGAIKGLKAGEFGPPPALGELGYGELQNLVQEAMAYVESQSPEEINALTDQAVTFKMGDFQLPFTASDFILSFSLPNFYFHATTTYDILRMLGVPLGKLDFLGAVRVAG